MRVGKVDYGEKELLREKKNENGFASELAFERNANGTE
jgi:hypothetical protein